LLGGAVIVEQVFAWPGLGRLIVESVMTRDIPVIQGFVLWMGLVFTTVSFLADALQRKVDPRIGKP
jgi:ABC-type dipeptide/oligopeptide/nickel transport system permease component